MKAVVLLSGGIDSSTTLAIAKDRGYECYALTISYGQTHSREIDSAEKVARSMNIVQHRKIDLPGDMFSGSALTGDLQIPVDRDVDNSKNIPDTYVPARNLIFLSIASGWAEVLGAEAIFIGVTALDYSGYPDCRPEFIRAFGKTVDLATKAGVEGRSISIEAPLINMTKDQIILLGKSLGLDYGLTWSCYTGGDKACGRCDSCSFRLKGFKKAGFEDPIEYE